MPWIVKLDKEEDFIGRWALEHYGEQPAETALVGFTLPDGNVPTEGAAVAGRQRRRRRPRHLVALLAAARQGHRDGLGARGARLRWRADHDRRRRLALRRDRPDQAVLRPRGEVLLPLSERYAFLSVTAPTSDVVARSPMERAARAAGARFEVRDGWNVAVRIRRRRTVGGEPSVADASHLGKLELHGPHRPGPGHRAARGRDAWCVPAHAARRSAIGDAGGREGVDVTSGYAALRIQGPLARELFARFCALDLRPHVTPPGAFRPGSRRRARPAWSCARRPTPTSRSSAPRVGEYVWAVVDRPSTSAPDRSARRARSRPYA